MSLDSLKKSVHFLKLILNASKLQAQALLDTATRQQLAAIIEVLDNIIAASEDTLTQAQLVVIQRWKKVLTRIVKKKRDRAELISRHYKIVHTVLVSFKQLILAKLDDELSQDCK